MLSEWGKLSLFLEQYDPESIVKENRIFELGENKTNRRIIRIYLSELCKAQYLKKLENGSYKVVRKVSSSKTISNIMFEGNKQEFQYLKN
jgi:hypothetical protein